MQQDRQVSIGTKTVGEGKPCFIIAEAGVNHNGNIDLAKKLIDAAVVAGADAVKFQTFKAENLVTSSANKAEYQKRTTNSSESQFEMLKKLELKKRDYRELSEYSNKKGIMFLSTPFDFESVDLLDELDVPAFKISSGDLTNLPLLQYAASKKKPLLISTGMSTLGEIEESVQLLNKINAHEIILLHCSTSYPAPLETVNLTVIKTLKCAFRKLVGYSDHTVGFVAPLCAVSLGACVIEKHFTLDKTLPGPDHKASAEPEELKYLIKAVHETKTTLGNGIRVLSEQEEEIKIVARKSLVAAKTIASGERLTKQSIAIKRPATGIQPKYYTDIIGKTAKVTIPKDTVITWEMIG